MLLCFCSVVGWYSEARKWNKVPNIICAFLINYLKVIGCLEFFSKLMSPIKVGFQMLFHIKKNGFEMMHNYGKDEALAVIMTKSDINLLIKRKRGRH